MSHSRNAQFCLLVFYLFSHVSDDRVRRDTRVAVTIEWSSHAIVRWNMTCE